MKQNRSKVSLIIVTYFTGPALNECLKASVAQADDVIIVNNGNDAKTMHYLRDFCEENTKASVIDGHGNIGFAAACNLGAKNSTGDLLMFLNPDAILHNDTINQLSSCLLAQKSLSIVGARLLNENGTEQRGARRGKLTLWSAFVSLSGLYRLEKLSKVFADMHWENRQLPEKPIQVPAISGACMMLRKKDFATIKEFDQQYFLHVEDLDICRSIINSGGKVIFVPHAEVTHIGSTSKAGVMLVSWYKSKGLIRYFIKFSNSTLEKMVVYLVSPLIIGAIMGRAIWITLRN